MGLDPQLIEAIKNNTSSEIIIQNTPLDSKEDVSELCDVMLENTHIRALSLTGCHIKEEPFQALCKVFGTHPSLCHLDLSGTFVPDENALIKAVADNKKCVSLNLTGTMLSDDVVNPLIVMPAYQHLFLVTTPKGEKVCRREKEIEGRALQLLYPETAKYPKDDFYARVADIENMIQQFEKIVFVMPEVLKKQSIELPKDMNVRAACVYLLGDMIFSTYSMEAKGNPYAQMVPETHRYQDINKKKICLMHGVRFSDEERLLFEAHARGVPTSDSKMNDNNRANEVADFLWKLQQQPISLDEEVCLTPSRPSVVERLQTHHASKKTHKEPTRSLSDPLPDLSHVAKLKQEERVPKHMHFSNKMEVFQDGKGKVVRRASDPTLERRGEKTELGFLDKLKQKASEVKVSFMGGGN